MTTATGPRVSPGRGDARIAPISARWRRPRALGGLSRRPGSVIYRKSGTWQRWHADAALVERNGKTYVAVALLESDNAQGVMSTLIVELDRLIAAGP